MLYKMSLLNVLGNVGLQTDPSRQTAVHNPIGGVHYVKHRVDEPDEMSMNA